MSAPVQPASGRSVLVTGGNGGIGLAVARAFAAAGDRVAVTHHASAPPDDLLAVKCDVTDPASVGEAVEAAVAEHGPIEVLVTAAGITRDGLAVRMSERDWNDVVDVNLSGAWHAAHAVLSPMLRARHGRLVFVSSVVGMLGSAGQASYAAAKSGLIGLARSLAREYGGRGITANVIAPGLVETRMTADLSEKQTTSILERTPIGRPATLDEIAAAVLFLAGDAAGSITGAVLPVDGGLGMGH